MCDNSEVNRIELRGCLEKAYSIQCSWCWSEISIKAHCADAATDDLISRGWTHAQDFQQIGIACPSCFSHSELGVKAVSDRLNKEKDPCSKP